MSWSLMSWFRRKPTKSQPDIVMELASAMQRSLDAVIAQSQFLLRQSDARDAAVRTYVVEQHQSALREILNATKIAIASVHARTDAETGRLFAATALASPSPAELADDPEPGDYPEEELPDLRDDEILGFSGPGRSE